MTLRIDWLIRCQMLREGHTVRRTWPSKHYVMDPRSSSPELLKSASKNATAVGAYLAGRLLPRDRPSKPREYTTVMSKAISSSQWCISQYSQSGLGKITKKVAVQLHQIDFDVQHFQQELGCDETVQRVRSLLRGFLKREGKEWEFWDQLKWTADDIATAQKRELEAQLRVPWAPEIPQQNGKTRSSAETPVVLGDMAVAATCIMNFYVTAGTTVEDASVQVQLRLGQLIASDFQGMPAVVDAAASQVSGAAQDWLRNKGGKSSAVGTTLTATTPEVTEDTPHHHAEPKPQSRPPVPPALAARTPAGLKRKLEPAAAAVVGHGGPTAIDAAVKKRRLDDPEDEEVDDDGGDDDDDDGADPLTLGPDDFSPSQMGLDIDVHWDLEGLRDGEGSVVTSPVPPNQGMPEEHTQPRFT